MEEITINGITLNNGKSVVERMKSEKKEHADELLTMVQGNTYRGVTITQSNIKNNSRSITNLWD